MDKKKALGLASFGYVITALISLVTMILYLNKPSLAGDLLSQYKSLKMTANAIIISTFVAAAIVSLLFFWAARRVAEGKSRGTILLVLVLFGVLGGFFSIFKTFNVASLVNLCFDVIILILLFMVRSEEDND